MTKRIDPPKTPRGGRQVFEKIAPSATEISVARSGFLKPYATCFQHLPDNIAREPLGLLAGVLVIRDRSENSAYIVNFLSSLAKKEYYGNPRRDAIESFEASLNKINLGLAELAKEGNTEWIGTLDAALCSIERNNLHFSVAGKAKVLLFRDGRLSDVSAGLADEDPDHPMKTFTDVASGKVSPDDRIIITTPEIFSTLSESELERSASRLPGEQFERFLRTALVNKLDLSATVLIDIGTVTEYERPLAPKRSLATPVSVPNAWSRAIFEASKKHGNSIEDGLKEKQEEKKERVDNKTGHIYVTGETSKYEENEFRERLHLFLEDARRLLQRIGHFIGSRVVPAALSLAKRLRDIPFQFIAHILQKRKERRVEDQEVSALSFQEVSPDTQKESTPLPEEIEVRTATVRRWSTSLSSFSKKTIRTLRVFTPAPASEENDTTPSPQNEPSEKSFQKYVQKSLHFLIIAFRKITAFIQTLSKKQKLFSALAIAIGALFLFLWLSPSKEPSALKEESLQNIPQEPIAPPTSPLSSDKNIRFMADPPIIFRGNGIIAVLQLGNTVFPIQKDALSSINQNGGEAIRVSYPNAAIARDATVMSDLNVILILGEDGKLSFFTPATGTFTEESISDSNDSSITSIGASSTYLYTLNISENAILRYPRAPGGFGAGTRWLKESVSLEPDTVFAISDSIYTADRSGIRAYFRGLQKDISFEVSATPIVSTALFADINTPTIFVLDGNNGRIIEYQTESGIILTQYTHQSLVGATRFTVNSATRTAFVAANDTVVMVDMR